MTTHKSDWTLLTELREELQQCEAADLEMRRARMLILIDELRTGVEERNNRRGDTIQILQNAFLAGVVPGETLSMEEHSQRFEDLEKTISGLDVTGLLYLFFSLEYEAANKIYSLYALAQTVDPAKIKEQCPWLPKSLVKDAIRALNASRLKAGRTMTKPGKGLVRDAWIEAGLHNRRAKHRELDGFARKMAVLHSCDEDTIRNNWIPTWRKELKEN